MATPTFPTSGAVASATATTLSVPFPAGVVAGDLVVIVMYIGSTSTATTINPPPGFAHAPNSPILPAGTSSTSGVCVFWKRATGAETTNYAIPVTTPSTSTPRRAIAVRVAGAAPVGNPWEGSNGTTGTGTATPAVSLTTTGAERLAIWVGGSFTTGTWTVPTGFTEQYPVSASDLLSWATRAIATATTLTGLTGTSVATSSARAAWVGALLPAVPVQVSTAAGDVAVEGVPVAVQHVAAVGAGDVAVEGPAASARLVVGAYPAAGDVAVEGPPVTLKRLVPADDVGDIAVEGGPVALSRRVPAHGVADVIVEGLPIAVVGMLDIDDVEVQGPPIQVSYSSRGTGGLGGIRAVPDAPATRFIVQSILTGEFLHWDLPIVNPTVTLTLSGPTSITGDLEPEDPEVRDLLAAGLEPWACWIHVETDGLIRASGILQPYQIDDEVLSVEAMGVSTYLHGTPYLGELSGIQIDPADVMRAIWAHVQSYPDGRLGVTVNGTTPVRIGEAAYTTPKLDANGTPETDPDTGAVIMEQVEAKPYTLMWWEGTDCGSEVDSLAQEAPFDYIERCTWNADRTGVTHWIDIGYPRLGTRRTDLRFATGENVTGAIPAEETDDLYASQVVLYGKGEGRDTIRGYAGRPLRKRLRRVAIIQDSTVATSERAAAISGDDLERRQGLVDVTDIEVEARHLNAQFGTYAPGDDILIDVEVGWLGRLRQYERILSVTYAPDGEAVRLQLRRAEAFRYGGAP